MSDQQRRELPGTTGNPFLEALGRRRDGEQTLPEEDLLARFGFAVPDDAALDVIARQSPAGVVELGAGTGYWARLLSDRGVDVVAFDVAPPPSPDNTWFAGQEPWFPVAVGDEHAVADHTDRTLLLVWPTRDEDWPADVALLHAAGGGPKLAYVGEPPGGRTGDLRFHAVLGLVDRCVACAYGVFDVPCTCDVTPRWELVEELALPGRPGADDHLYVFDPAGPRSGRRRTTRSASSRDRPRRRHLIRRRDA